MWRAYTDYIATSQTTRKQQIQKMNSLSSTSHEKPHPPLPHPTHFPATQYAASTRKHPQLTLAQKSSLSPNHARPPPNSHPSSSLSEPITFNIVVTAGSVLVAAPALKRYASLGDLSKDEEEETQREDIILPPILRLTRRMVEQDLAPSRTVSHPQYLRPPSHLRLRSQTT
jgi:hypothetical protein